MRTVETAATIWRWESWLLAVLCGLLSGVAGATALGEIEVESVLNERFFARIEVVSGDNDPTRWQIRLASAEEYEELGIQRVSYIDRLRASVIQPFGRAPEIHIEGSVPLKDLILDLVLVVRIDGDQRLRHYPVLIDFPAIAAPARPEPAAPVVQQPRRPIPPAPRRALPIVEIDATPSGQTYTVVSGDNLYVIAKRIGAGRGLDINEVMDAIIALNPDAFIRGDINLLRAGVNLDLPDLGASPVANTATMGADRSQSAGGTPRPSGFDPTPAVSAPGAADPRLELQAAPDTETIVENLNTWLEGDEELAAHRIGEVRRDLAFAAAEIETYRKENDLLKGRISGLEDRIVEMERLLSLQTQLIRTIDEEETPADAPQAGELAEEAHESESADQPVADLTSDDEAPEALAADPEIQDEESSWIIFPSVAGALLLIFGLVVIVRSIREDRQRRRRTAELTSRLKESAGRDVLPDR